MDHGFESTAEITSFVKQLVLDLRTAGFDPEALEDTIHAYTTSSEWYGELGIAVRKIQQHERLNPDFQARLNRIIALVNTVWPNL